MIYPIKPTSTLLALLKAGYSVSSPDLRFTLETKFQQSNKLVLFSIPAEETIETYPMNEAGLTQAIERMNLPTGGDT